MRLATYEITIAAPPDVVWEHLTTAAGLVRWVGPEATADPVPGGPLRWVHPNGATVVGRFVELVRPRRVVFTYGWEDGRMGVGPETTTVEIDLVEEDGKTVLRLVHHGLPPAAVADHERGWAYFLGVLDGILTKAMAATVLFVCLHNAGRSQMSAALFERAAEGRHHALSAGTTPADRVHPEVVDVMRELGVDLSDRTPRKLTHELAAQADVIVTMGCGDQCPYIPGKRYVDWDLQDPKGRPLDEVRATRDDIAARVRALVDELDTT